MIEFYPQIKSVHVACVIASGLLFSLRGAAVLAGARWAMAAPLRYLSYSIDSALLTAVLMLLTVLKLNPFVVPWLAVKLLLLVAYVVLGSLALKRARSRRVQAVCYAVALMIYTFIYFVARTHQPLGLLQGLLG